jgi:hypothetical protein
MQDKNADFPIAFAVYRREVGFDQSLNSAFAYGKKINNFSVRWRWINVQAKFLKSNDIVKLTANQTGISPNQDLIFIDWLRRTVEKFLEGSSGHLVILNSSLYLSDSFEELVLRSMESIQEPVAAISLWPVPPLTDQPIKGSSDVYSATEISKLAFIFSRSACLKILPIIISNPLIRFDELIKALEISSLTVAENATGRPYLWLDIVASEDLLDLTISHDSNASELFESSVVVENRIPKVHAYISHWYSTWGNIEIIEKSCLAANYRTTVLNTTDVQREGWVNGLSISFFRQFEVACRSFDQSNDYMFFVTADVVSQEWSEFFDYASKVLVLESVGTFSPTLTHEFFHLGRRQNFFFDPGLPLSIVQNNDLIVIYIDRDAILEMINFFDFFNAAEDTFDPIVGFGVMEALTSIINSKNLMHVRDRSFTLRHPEGSSYDSKIAIEERRIIYEISERFCNEKNYLWWKWSEKSLLELSGEVPLEGIKGIR